MSYSGSVVICRTYLKTGKKNNQKILPFKIRNGGIIQQRVMLKILK